MRRRERINRARLVGAPLPFDPLMQLSLLPQVTFIILANNGHITDNEARVRLLPQVGRGPGAVFPVQELVLLREHGPRHARDTARRDWADTA